MTATLRTASAKVRHLRRTLREAAFIPRSPIIPLRTDFLGSEYGGWWIWPDPLSSASVAYSFGVGTDISFDCALIDRFDIVVHAFDPTPRCIQWIRSARLPAQLRFYPIGLSNVDGRARFKPPAREQHVSYALNRDAADDDDVVCEVQRLETIARRLGHTRIDLLKIDIEGEEYAVISDICATSVAIGQLLVEFHGPLGFRRRSRIRRAMSDLHRAGMQLFWVSNSGSEYSFVERALVTRSPEAGR